MTSEGRRRGRGVRLKNIAAHAGVSVKTVSNVVNKFSYVTDETRDKVQRAIDELGYRPNLTARSLRSGRTGLVALAVSEIDVPYFSELARLIIKAADEHGLTALIDQTDGVPDRELPVLAGISKPLIDGQIGVRDHFTPASWRGISVTPAGRSEAGR